MFIETLSKNPSYFFTISTVMISSVLIIELVRWIIANVLKDSTAENQQGLLKFHFSKNFILYLIIFAVSGILITSKSTFDSVVFKNRWSKFIIILVGRLFNVALVLFGIFGGVLLSILLGPSNKWSAIEISIVYSFYYLALINCVLFLLNLIPLGGFDGAILLEELIPKFKEYNVRFDKLSFVLIIVLLYSGGVGWLYWISDIFIRQVYNVIGGA